jgi:hypothetical protein
MATEPNYVELACNRIFTNPQLRPLRKFAKRLKTWQNCESFCKFLLENDLSEIMLCADILSPEGLVCAATHEAAHAVAAAFVGLQVDCATIIPDVEHPGISGYVDVSSEDLSTLPKYDFYKWRHVFVSIAGEVAVANKTRAIVPGYEGDFCIAGKIIEQLADGGAGYFPWSESTVFALIRFVTDRSLWAAIEWLESKLLYQGYVSGDVIMDYCNNLKIALDGRNDVVNCLHGMQDTCISDVNGEINLEIENFLGNLSFKQELASLSQCQLENSSVVPRLLVKIGLQEYILQNISILLGKSEHEGLPRVTKFRQLGTSMKGYLSPVIY